MKRRHRIFSAVIAIILALTMLGSIIVTIVTSLSANAVTEAEIEALKAEGLARLDERPDGPGGPHFALTRSGMLISNAVIEQCFENIPEAPRK